MSPKGYPNYCRMPKKTDFGDPNGFEKRRGGVNGYEAGRPPIASRIVSGFGDAGQGAA